MGKYLPAQKRIVGVFGHHNSGKTTLLDAVLKNYYSGADRIGQRYLDSEPIEKEKAASFSNHITTVDFEDTRLYFIDTPGSTEFLGDLQTAINASDNILLIVNGTAGVEVSTERIWQMAREQNKPVIVFVSQMDKDGADYDKVISDLKEAFQDGVKLTPVQVPIGQGNNFKGITNVLLKKSFTYDVSTGKASEMPSLAPESQAWYDKYHDQAIEDIVENDEDILNKYFEGGEEAITTEELIKCLKKAVGEGTVVPVLIGSALHNAGIDRLMFSLKNYGVSPENSKYSNVNGETIENSDKFTGLIIKNAVDPFVGKLTYLRILSGTLKASDSFYVVQEDSNEKFSHLYIPRFDKNEEIEEASLGDVVVIPKLKNSKIGQTVVSAGQNGIVKVPDFPEPMISKSISPKSKNEIDKITGALSKLSESDPTFKWEFDPETSETVISGIGTIHLEVMTERLRKNFGVDFEIGKPKIAYRETIKRKTNAEYKHKKQTGGHGQYGHVKIEVEPLERGSGYIFEDKIVGGVIPKNYIPSVDKGILEAIKKGILAAFPVVDIKVILYDGSYHDVDSSDIAFQIAARSAFKIALESANPVLLEPIMKVDIFVPSANTGDAMGEVTAKRGRPLGMENVGRGLDKIMAEIPLAEMLDFSPRLSSITSGKGYFSMKFEKYMEVTPEIQKKIVAERQAEMAAEQK